MNWNDEEVVKLIEKTILKEQMSLRESIRYIIQLKGGKPIWNKTKA